MIKISSDGFLDIAIGRNRKESVYQNKKMLWSKLLERVEETHRTFETYQEYMKMTKDRQDDLKDVGGFVGGYLKDGSRKQVLHRQLICLDADFGTLDVWDDWNMLYGNACALYTTHKHSKEKIRFRLLIPLDRPVNTEEYQAIARMIASDINIEAFDDTTYQAQRMMYFPSTSKDGEYIFKYTDGEWLRADDILKKYIDWRDSSSWPTSSRVNIKIQSEIKRQEDPLTKKGIIGAFCRTYSIQEAITKYLSDIYVPCEIENRYTYVKGSTSAGLIVYEDKYAYSHHSTDPAGQMLCNAFDLVRLHLFSELDSNAKEGTPVNKKPSFVKVCEMITDDEDVKLLMGKEKLLEANEDFDVSENTDWIKQLEFDNRGNILATTDNIVIILENDPMLKGKLGFNEFEHREVAMENLPWRKIKGDSALKDTDDAEIRYYLEKNYKIVSAGKIKDALSVVVTKHTYHPIKEYFSECVWDGVSRVDTLLIDYLGAEDTEYVRAVTRKTLCGAVARVLVPGIKFDTILVLVGKQGLGKSQLVNKLGVQWYSDSLTTVSGKEAYEQLQGVWIMEMGELAAMKKAEVEATKHFISKQEDRYRVAYGRRVENFPRQTIFVGTTNEDNFLRDSTGNRRFWPIDCGQPKKNMWEDLTPAVIKKIWAEAIVLWDNGKGEQLFLDSGLEKVALEKQEEHKEEDYRIGMIKEYLDMPLPPNWPEMALSERRAYIQDDDIVTNIEDGVRRDRVCVLEIWTELFNGEPKKLTDYDSRIYNRILAELPDWERHKAGGGGLLRFGKIYGRQRAYVRKNDKH